MAAMLLLKKNHFNLSDKNKYWFKLLHHFDKNNYFQNGLTLPFIIGSRKYIEPNKKLQTVEELINDFNNSIFHINILKCPGIGEYVFRICDDGDEKTYRTLENFVITDYSFAKYKNITEIITELEDKYNQYIIAEKFSRNIGEWNFFDLNKDVPKIKEVK